MSGCTNEGPFEGGTYIEPTIVGGKATGTEVSNGTLTGSLVVDSGVARDIADAICPLVADCVEAPVVVATDSPASTTALVLPTTIVGNREYLIAKPDVWLEFGNYRIPAYTVNGG